MELTINHKPRTFADPLPDSLEKLIRLEIQERTKGVAVALNHQVIPKSEWAQTFLKNKDSILIITATQGG